MTNRRNRTTTTKWNLFFQYISIGLSIISGVVLVPIYLKFIPLDLYGAWLATGNILVLITIIDPGLSQVLMRQVGVAYGQNDKKSIQEFIISGSIITLFVVIFVIATAMIITDYIPSWLNLKEDIDIVTLKKAFVLASLGSALMIFSFTFTSINQGLQASLSIGIIFVVISVLRIGIIIILLYQGFGLLSIAVGQLIMGSGLLVGNIGYLSWRIINDKIAISFSLKALPKLVNFVSFVFLSKMSVIICQKIDLFIVARLLGPESSVMLKLTRTAPDLSRHFVERPVIAFMPSLAQLVGSGGIEKAKTVILRLARLMLWLLGILLGGFVAMNDDFVRLWVGPQLFAGHVVGLAISVGFFLLVGTSILGNFCFVLGNIKAKSLAEFVQSLLYIFLIVFGTRYFGLIGCVFAPLIAMAAVTVWYFPRSFIRLLKLLPEQGFIILREVLIIIAVIIPLTVIFCTFTPLHWFTFTIIAASFVILYFSGLFILSKEFRMEIVGIYQKFTRGFIK